MTSRAGMTSYRRRARARARRQTTERVTDLGNDERKQLPPLKLSMHMWNDASSERFVIIDGTRLGVGDHLGASSSPTSCRTAWCSTGTGAR